MSHGKALKVENLQQPQCTRPIAFHSHSRFPNSYKQPVRAAKKKNVHCTLLHSLYAQTSVSPRWLGPCFPISSRDLEICLKHSPVHCGEIRCITATPLLFPLVLIYCTSCPRHRAALCRCSHWLWRCLTLGCGVLYTP